MCILFLLSFGQVPLIKNAQCVFSLFTSSGSSVNKSVKRAFLFTSCSYFCNSDDGPGDVSCTLGSLNCDTSVPYRGCQLSNESPQTP